jgi:hypothetical protein
MEAICSSGTSVDFQRATRCYIAEPFRHLPVDTGGNTKIPRISGIAAEIRTGHLTNISEKHYRFLGACNAWLGNKMKSLLTLHSEVEVYVNWRIFRCAAFSRQNPHFLFGTRLDSILELEASPFIPFLSSPRAWWDSTTVRPRRILSCFTIHSHPLLRRCISPTLRRWGIVVTVRSKRRMSSYRLGMMKLGALNREYWHRSSSSWSCGYRISLVEQLRWGLLQADTGIVATMLPLASITIHNHPLYLIGRTRTPKLEEEASLSSLIYTKKRIWGKTE